MFQVVLVTRRARVKASMGIILIKHAFLVFPLRRMFTLWNL